MGVLQPLFQIVRSRRIPLILLLSEDGFSFPLLQEHDREFIDSSVDVFLLESILRESDYPLQALLKSEHSIPSQHSRKASYYSCLSSGERQSGIKGLP